MHFQWRDLPAFPQPVAGQFVGVSDEALVVAGGAFFPVSLFEGGQKRWVDDVFVLVPGDSAWRHAGKLPWPRAYGAAISTPGGIICIGGSDAERYYRTGFQTGLPVKTKDRAGVPLQIMIAGKNARPGGRKDGTTAGINGMTDRKTGIKDVNGGETGGKNEKNGSKIIHLSLPA